VSLPVMTLSRRCCHSGPVDMSDSADAVMISWREAISEEGARRRRQSSTDLRRSASIPQLVGDLQRSTVCLSAGYCARRTRWLAVPAR